MDAPRLDRLTALLEGLNPQVTLTAEPSGVALYILQKMQPHQNPDDFSRVDVNDLAVLLCPAGDLTANALQTISAVS